jgi:hypothetical protein
VDQRPERPFAGDHQVMPLPPPQVVACYFDIGFMPPIAAMLLQWPAPQDAQESTWKLPRGESVAGRLPRRFGVRIRRQAEDAYAVALVWDSTYRQWFSLRRREVLDTALEAVLLAMGTRLDYLLDQPPLSGVA